MTCNVPVLLLVSLIFVNVTLVFLYLQTCRRLLDARRCVFHLLRTIGVVKTVVPGNVGEAEAQEVHIVEQPGRRLLGETVAPLIVYVPPGDQS